MMCGTVTYPIAVRIARKVFRLRGFYAIHLAIAPFLGFVHTNIFGSIWMYVFIKQKEKEFEFYFGQQKAREGLPKYDDVHASYYKLKDTVVKH